MTLERRIATFFRLNDENWMRHANPVSVWTRYSVLPIIVISVWSRVWIGGWYVVPLIASIAWMFLNPILFKKPTSTKNWASKAVLGERVFLNRDQIEIPDKHVTPLHNVLNGTAFVALLIAIYSAITYSVEGSIFGTLLAVLAKSWFLDRMVWLYEDMKDNNDNYQSWEY